MSEAAITEIADVNPPLPRHVRDDEIVSFVRMADLKEGLRGSQWVLFCTPS